MNRLVLAALAALVAITPVRLAAQQQESYQQKRAELMKQLDSTQHAFSQLQQQRLQMAARIENVMSQVAEARAQTLALSNEQNALKQIDSLLLATQDNLAGQRDRLTTLGNAVRDRAGAMLVVLFRADSGGAPVQSATLSIDGGSTSERTYSDVANGAMKVGAVDEVFRGNVLPVAHTLTFVANVNGKPLTSTASVSASGQSVTYVQFALRNGQLVQTSWSSRGTTPF